MMEELQLDHTVHFATTLFNVATAYRTAGNTRKHLQIIGVPLKFIKRASKDDYRLAELYSASDFYWKAQQKRKCGAVLEKAIQIMENSLEQGLKWRLPDESCTDRAENGQAGSGGKASRACDFRV